MPIAILLSSLGADTSAAGLQAESSFDRESAYSRIVGERKKLIQTLIALAGEKIDKLPSGLNPNRDSKHLAILLLGELRAAEAIPVLLDNLEYKNPKSKRVGLTMSGAWYPASEALANIGTPAAFPVIRKLATYGQDGEARRNCCWILERIYGRQIAKLAVQLAIEEATDESAKANLKASLIHFEPRRGEDPRLYKPRIWDAPAKPHTSP